VLGSALATREKSSASGGLCTKLVPRLPRRCLIVSRTSLVLPTRANAVRRGSWCPTRPHGSTGEIPAYRLEQPTQDDVAGWTTSDRLFDSGWGTGPGIEQAYQLASKVRKLSTQVHQRCHKHNVIPVDEALPLSGRLPGR